MISILIPTLNEEDWIAHSVRAVRASLRSSGVAGEIIVADGDSSDATVERADTAGADRIVISDRRHRARQLNLAAREASGDMLVFLHADTLVRPEWAADIHSAASDGAVGGWFQIEIIPELQTFQGNHGLDPMAFGINWRTRLFRTATADQSIFVRRDVFESLGGIPEIPLMDGKALAERLRDAGPIVIGGKHVRISGRRWERGGLLRTMCLMFLLRGGFQLGVDPEFLHTAWRTLTSR